MTGRPVPAAYPLTQLARRRLVLGLLLSGGAFTLAVWLAPGFDVAYGAEGMHIALQAVAGTVSAGVGWLAWSRFTQDRRLGDLVVAVTFGLLIAGASIFAFVVPTLLNHEVLQPSVVWSSATLTSVATPLLVLSVAAGRRQVTGRQTVAVLALVGALAAGAILTGVLAGRRLGLPIDPALSPVGGHHTPYAGSHAFLGLATVSALLLFGATALAVRRQRPGDDPLYGWLGPSLVINALAWTNYALFPSVYSYWVYSGDIVQLAFYLVLVLGIALELRASVQRAIAVAVLEERRRLARDLHDGVAQELSFVLTELDRLHPPVPHIRSAADRGLYEARRAIDALTTPLHRPLAESLTAAAADLGERIGVALELDLDPTLNLTREQNEAALRVMREATLNAAHHADATRVQIHLCRDADGDVQLEIADDGCGIRPTAKRQGFGLTSMRERAETTGGRFTLTSVRGSGTVVAASWPLER